MAQLKKKAMLLIGALILLLGMGMNLQYALDDYGFNNCNLQAIILVQASETGEDPSGTGGPGSAADLNPCDDCNKAGGVGAVSCECTSSSVSVGGSGGGGDHCSVSVGTGYYACCRKTSAGTCACPACKVK